MLSKLRKVAYSFETNWRVWALASPTGLNPVVDEIGQFNSATLRQIGRMAEFGLLHALGGREIVRSFGPNPNPSAGRPGHQGEPNCFENSRR